MALTLKQTQEKELKKFDDFIDQLPSRVHETPREVLKEFLLSAMEASAKGERQQLLKAVEEMGKDPKSTWEDDRGYNQALDDVLDLLKAKDYMEGV